MSSEFRNLAEFRNVNAEAVVKAIETLCSEYRPNMMTSACEMRVRVTASGEDFEFDVDEGFRFDLTYREE